MVLKLSLIFFLILGCSPEVVYKCPKGQVTVRENAGTDQEVIRCYVPGISYTDYRPSNVTEINHWKEGD